MSLQRSIVKLLLNTPLSLADLQAATGVSLPTLRKAVQGLMDARWIRVVGQADANGGRPAMLFGADESHFAVIGAHLQLPGIHLTLTDLAGNVLDDIEIFDGVLPTPDEAMQSIADYVGRIAAAFPARQLLGVGLAAPGFIDLATGDIITIGRVPSWENVAICRRLQAVLGLPVDIANDVDCLAFAELHYARQPSAANLAYIGFDEGVKVSLFLRGELYKGTFGNVGLTASSLLRIADLADPAETPHLLTINGISRLFEQRLAGLAASDRRLYTDILAAASARERVQRILANARPELPVCHALAQDQIKALAGVATNMILLVQPDVVLIGGLLSLLPQELFTALEMAIRRQLPALISHNTLIQQGRLVSQSSGAIGAALHFLQAYLGRATGDLA